VFDAYKSEIQAAAIEAMAEKAFKPDGHAYALAMNNARSLRIKASQGEDV